MMWLVIIALVALLLIYFSLYNTLITLKHRVDNAWSQIDVQLQRRFDLIPNLVESVKGYIGHESEVLTKVAELRTSWASAGTVGEKAELENQLSGTLKTIMAVSENYPELKADQSFLNLQAELTETEEKIAFTRQSYNDTATRYNTKLEVIPTNFVAAMHSVRFQPAELYKVQDEAAKSNVKVSF